MLCLINGLLLSIIVPAGVAAGQIVEHFDDGDLTRDPPWSGDLERWQFLPAGDGLALFTNGLARTDTLSLTTPLSTTAGAWTFEAGYRNGRLSNFNLIRVYLMAGDARLDRPVDGYYVQIGGNEREIRLYRASAGGGRTLLTRHATELLQVDAQALRITATRSVEGVWDLFLDDRLVAAGIEDDTPLFASSVFGLWVKHTASRPADVWFDGIVVTPDTTEVRGPPPSPYAPPAPGDVVLNEIDYAPPDPGLEFVEVLNTSPDTLNLCDVQVADDRSDPVAACTGVRPLRPGAFGVVARDSAALAGAFPGTRPAAPASWPALNNTGDTVRLLAGGRLLDEVAYHPGWGGQGVSLERRDPAGPSGEAFNWGSCRDPAGATPGRINSLFAPDTTPPRLIFVERTEPRVLTAVWDEAVALAPADAFRAGALRPASVSPEDDVTLRLRFLEAVDAAELEAAGVADRTGNALAVDRFPIALPPTAGQLYINEIMYEPRADPLDRFPDQPEYVELFNASDALLSLRNVALAGPAGDTGSADTLRSFARLPVLAPGGFAVLFAGDSAGVLRAAFPSLRDAAAPVTYLPVDAAGLGLNNDGDLARIVGSAGSVLDETAYAPAWHHANLAETRGIALERRTIDAPAHLPGNWGSSTAPEGGTPGRPNAIRTPAPDGAARIRLYPDPFTPDGDGVDDVLAIEMHFDGAPLLVTLRIYDARGRPVRTLTPGTLAGTEAYYFWDGRFDDGRPAPVGLYIVLLEATDLERGRQIVTRSTAVLAWSRR